MKLIARIFLLLTATTLAYIALLSNSVSATEKTPNYKITDIKPSVFLAQNAPSGQNISLTFTVTVDRDDKTLNYSTSLENPKVTLLGYSITPSGGSAEEYKTLQKAINGGEYEGTSGFCKYYQEVLGSLFDSCEEVKNQNTTLDGYPKDTTHNGNNGQFTFTETYTMKSTLIPDLAIGKKYCLAIVVGKASSSSDKYMISKSTCTNISDYPSFRVWGGNIQTNGGVQASVKTVNEKTYGSYGEFALIANGQIRTMASGAAVAGNKSFSDLLCEISPLTVSNQKCSSGNIGSSRIIKSNSLANYIIEKYNADAAEPLEVSNATIFNDNRDGFSCSEVGATNLSGRSPLIVYCKDSATITKNIQPRLVSYQDSNIPQIIIIAENDIVISGDVETINAWLISKNGKINTCDSRKIKELDANACGTELKINGMVMAEKIELRRISVAEEPQDGPHGYAETINFNPTIYFFGYNEAYNIGYPRITYLKKMAPRY